MPGFYSEESYFQTGCMHGGTKKLGTRLYIVNIFLTALAVLSCTTRYFYADSTIILFFNPTVVKLTVTVSAIGQCRLPPLSSEDAGVVHQVMENCNMDAISSGSNVAVYPKMLIHNRVIF